MSSPTKEALLEAGRVLLLALISGILTFGAIYVADANLSPEWLAVWGILGTVLRAADKYLHEYGKDTKSEGLTKGLTRF